LDHSENRSLDPRGEYSRRLEASQALASGLARRDDAFANARLAVFGLGLVLAILAWRGSIPPAWLVLPFVGFVALVLVHGQILAARRRAEGKSAYHERGLGRLDDRWSGSGVSGVRFLDEEHPYAGDLDLFGEGSLFERLCTARTSSGESCLASWLLRPASIPEIRQRHDAVRELRPMLDFREDLALLGDDVRSGVAPESLAEWGRNSRKSASTVLRWLIGLVAGSTLISAIGWMAGAWSYRSFLVLLAVEGVIAAVFAKRATRALADVEERSGELKTLAGLLARVEREPFTSPRLRELKDALQGHGSSASSRIGRLATLVVWLEARHNVYFALFGSFFLWKTQFALAIEAWREAEGASISRWLEVVGEVEAYGSLASFSFENPADPFPELVEEGPIIEGDQLGHPLLPASRCVRNDFKLGGPLRVLSVSGSNMSGKSTWLRTVGINAVLAQAGATVRADRFRLSSLAIGGTLRVHDSLQAGRSRFYAEVLRLKQLVEMASQSPPLLFLIDEILHGTNSHDRLQGAEAVVRGLIDRGAIGLFTTHDLALAEVAGRLAPRAENVHFADHLDDNGRLAFDYRMRPGVVRQSNALALMRAVGLDV
jgi:MutS domain V